MSITKKPQVLACGFFVCNHCIFPYGHPCNSHAILALVLTCTDVLCCWVYYAQIHQVKIVANVINVCKILLTKLVWGFNQLKTLSFGKFGMAGLINFIKVADNGLDLSIFISEMG